MRRLALIAALMVLAAPQARAGTEPTPGSSCAGQTANSFTWSGASQNGGVTDGMFCNGSTNLYTGIINFQSSGQVGIGTTSPGASYILDVSEGVSYDIRTTGASNTGANGLVLENTSSSTRDWYLAAAGNGSAIGPAKGFIIRDSTAGATRLAIDTTGNVGIGTTTPNDLLTLHGAGAGGGFGMDLDDTAAAGGSYWGVYTTDNGNCATAGSLIFLNGKGASSCSAALAITTGGKVGIGTINPDTSLQVAGDAHVNGTVYTSWVNGGGGLNIGFGSNNSYTQFMANSGQYFAFIDNGYNDLVRITGAGKVGIGTTSPGAKLDVAGAVKLSDTGQNCGHAADTGTVRFNSSTQKLQYCVNGSGWKNVNESGPVLISTQTASNSASLQFSGANWSSSYTTLFLNCAGLTVTTTGTQYYLVYVGEGAGPTWKTASTYTSSTIRVINGGAPGGYCGGTSNTDLLCATDFNTPASVFSTKMYIDNVSSSTLPKVATSITSMSFDGNNNLPSSFSGFSFWNADTNPITGLEVTTNTGTIHTGTCSLYGMN